MKIYVLEYDAIDFNSNKLHKVRTYLPSEVASFKEDVELIKDNYYSENLKAYSGELTEIKDLNIIINQSEGEII